MMDEVIDDKEILCTRAKEYVKSNETIKSTPNWANWTKKDLVHKINFFVYKDQHVLPLSLADKWSL